MRAIVTGGAGFIGSHVCDAFLAAGFEVVALDDLSTGRSENVPVGVELRRVDIVHAERLTQVVRDVRPNVIAHLAAQSSVTVSVKDPVRDLDVNVRGTLNLLQAAAELGTPTVFASTGGALYGDDAPVPTPEDAITPSPLAPYGASKLAGEAYIGTWGRLHAIPNVILRLGNVYGPRQSSTGEAGVVAIFADHLLRGQEPTVFGDGRQTRDYIHVSDVASAFVTAAQSGRAGTYNVGWGQETDVLTLLRVLQAAAGTSLDPRFHPLRNGELKRSCLDSSRLRDVLGWAPVVEFETGLRETLEAYAA
jgi:UDP-glucose 4-epimerase